MSLLERSVHDAAAASDVLEAHVLNSPLGVVGFDASFRVTRWSQEAERIFGYTAEEIIGKAIADLRWVHEDDVHLVEAESRGLLDGSRPRTKNVNRNYRKDGSVIWCEWYSSAVYDEQGSLKSVLSLVLDVTDRHATESELRRTADLNEALSAIDHLILGMPTTVGIIQSVVSEARRSLGCDSVTVDVKDGDAWVLRYTDGMPHEYVGSRFAESDIPFAMTAIATRAPVVIDDSLTDERVHRDVQERYNVRSVVVAPLVLEDDVFGLIFFNHHELQHTFTPSEVVFAERLASSLSLALENARLMDSEHQRIRRIEALHQVLELAVSSLNVRESAQRILDYLVQYHGFELANTWLATGEYLELLAAVNYPREYSEQFSPMPLTARYDAVKVFKTGRPIVVHDVAQSSPAVKEMYERIGTALGSYVIVPLRSRGATIGTLHFGWSAPRTIDHEEVSFLESLGAEVGVVLENAALYETEHNIAETLQETLVVLPSRVPGVSYARSYESATTERGRVGGDFVDVFPVAAHRVGISLGDVSGKGVDAAVITSLVRTALRVHAIDGLPAVDVVAKANDVVRNFTPHDSFVTLWFGILNTRSGDLSYVCAGHPPALVVTEEGDVRELPGRNPFIGAFTNIRFTETRHRLSHGDRLVLYSDGVIEARSRHGGLFTEDRLRSLLRRLRGCSPHAMSRRVLDEVLSFSKGVLRDDAAVLVVEAKKVRRASAQQTHD